MDKRTLFGRLLALLLVAGVMTDSVLVGNMGAKYQNEVQQANALHRELNVTRQDLDSSDKQVTALQAQVTTLKSQVEQDQKTLKAQAEKISTLEKRTSAPF